MAEAASARTRFERLAHIIAAASREGGAEVASLARNLGTCEAGVLDDLRELTTRGDYRPGGWPGDILVFLDNDRVRVEHTSFLDRPLRLSGHEHLCLALALRGEPAQGSRAPDAEDLLRLGPSLVAGGRDPGEALGSAPGLTLSDRRMGRTEVHRTVVAAAYARRPCVMGYLKLAAGEESRRVVHPYLVVFSDETWYVVGHCVVSQGMRIFRMDRILHASLDEGTFDIPSDFDPGPYLDGGLDELLFASVSRRAYVRYSPRVGRWIRERASYRSISMEDNGDGSVTVCHSVADPDWLARHVLRYGGEAVVEGPEDLRRRVRDIARRLAGLATGNPEQ